jgi:AraC-like DNA-binding protein
MDAADDCYLSFVPVVKMRSPDAYGKSFTEYINDIRCGETCLLLRSTDKPVSMIATECGFETLSHFNRQFRQRFGVSPREFRSRV